MSELLLGKTVQALAFDTEAVTKEACDLLIKGGIRFNVIRVPHSLLPDSKLKKDSFQLVNRSKNADADANWDKTNTKKIYYEELFILKADGNRTTFKFIENNSLKEFKISKTLKCSKELYLRNKPYFFQIDRTYIVNLKFAEYEEAKNELILQHNVLKKRFLPAQSKIKGLIKVLNEMTEF